MSVNDLILLNQFLETRRAEVGTDLGESDFFELFVAEQVLKDDDLSYDDLEDGVVDGSGDGGIDSIYFFVNDVLFNEDEDYSVLRKNVSLRLVLVQSKTTAGFSEAALDRLNASAADLFDLNKEIANLRSVYNESLLKKIQEFRATYLLLSTRFPSLSFRYAYATKATDLNENVKRKVDILQKTLEGLFSPVSFAFEFLDASALLGLARDNPSRSSSLKLAESPISTGQAGFVCLVALRDYLSFITDEKGQLRSYMFEGNVRDYQGKNEVNKEIQETLESETDEDFWWLNNGVSIICTDASLSSLKTLTMEDAEIVNGLQTSREIYDTLQERDLSGENRNLLVRVLKPADQASRDRIIKATNSQTPIPAASLRATDKIHRDIEEYLHPRGLYYDRRKNFYKNTGKPIKRILTIPFVAQSVMACALSDPSNARARPSSLLKNDETYGRIFNDTYPLDIYFKCPMIVREVELILRDTAQPEIRPHINNIRFYVAMAWTLAQTGLPSPSIQKIAEVEVSNLTAASLAPFTKEVLEEYQTLGGNDQVAKGRDLVKRLLDLHQERAREALRNAATVGT